MKVKKEQKSDRDYDAPLLNIVFKGGTFGNFLRFFLDKFSQLTPEIPEHPVTNLGTSHKKISYSNKIKRQHEDFIDEYKEKTNLNICQILPITNLDYLYLKASQWVRAGDALQRPNHLWQKTIDSLMMTSRLKKSTKEILSLYDLSDTVEKIPKFIVRDWYKLEFLQDLSNHYNYFSFQEFKDHDFFKKQKTHHFPMESFFEFDVFLKNVRLLDSEFSLKLNFHKKKQMKDMFDKSYNLDVYRQQINHAKKIIKSLNIDENVEIQELDVSIEAFIYAHLEKNYTNIQMPLVNDFFKSSRDIKQYIKCFPNWYKKPNPNL